MSQYIHGTTTPQEIARLDVQGDWTASFTFDTFDAAPGMRVLDLATGVGAMAKRLLKSFPGIDLVGVDASTTQLQAAQQMLPHVTFVEARAEALPFESESFDRVHCSWLLEHVSNPEAVVKEVRRVLKRGGYCQFIEVDNASFASTPLLGNVNALLRTLNAAQVRAGGDPFVGQRLHHIFKAGDFRRFTVEPRRLVATNATPDFMRRFIEEFVGIFESVEASLGEEHRPTIQAAVAELKSLPGHNPASLRFTAMLAQGFR